MMPDFEQLMKDYLLAGFTVSIRMADIPHHIEINISKGDKHAKTVTPTSEQLNVALCMAKVYWNDKHEVDAPPPPETQQDANA